MKLGYARVSTQDQNLALQLDALNAAGCQRVFQEKVSGGKAERPELSRLLEILREGDTMLIWKLDRLGRSPNHLIEIVTELEQRRIGLVSLNDPIYTEMVLKIRTRNFFNFVYHEPIPTTKTKVYRRV